MTRLRATLLTALIVLLGGCAATGEDPTAEWSAARLYEEAKSALDSGDYEQAISHYETLEARYPFGRYAQQAQLEIAYAYYKYGEMDSAIAAADRFIKLNPRHPHVAYAYYLRGLANFDRGASILDKIITRDPAEMDMASVKSAFDDFATVVRRFPESIYAADARQRTIYLRNVLARHELKVADYYLRRGAYVAVVNRCKYVLEHYQGSDAMPQALRMMAEAYEHLGLPELAADARRVLELNYPGQAPAEHQPAEN